MNEKKFIKEHPSLKERFGRVSGKDVIDMFKAMDRGLNNSSKITLEKEMKTAIRQFNYFIEDIHKTQLDKAKVRDVINKANKMVEKPSEWKEDIIEFIKKEFGIK